VALRFGLALMNDFPGNVVPAHRLPLLREQVRVARECGISSIWVLQHYLGSMPTLQPLPLLAALAADAGDLMLGTNMFILPLRHPVDVAEEFATLDHITNGRVIAGFGMGYRQNEFDSYGLSLEDRVGRYEESIQIIRSLWSGRPTSFTGRHFAIDAQTISLPPIQPGGPPIWIGAGPHRVGARRAAECGDAWIVPPHVSPQRLDVLLGHYREERARIGAPVAELAVRRELLLDPDPDRARATGLAARGALSQQYARYNAPQPGAAYQHLRGPAEAEEVADASYLFTDPQGAVERLRRLEKQGITTVILRAQWYDLPQEQVLRTLELFRDHVLPEFR
jgi:alkanesulfonate monooxygenase SsuD/methylene tetrahydromethanopterin reductase-like flavin-dependent oxidoreductase (luciferase family)